MIRFHYRNIQIFKHFNHIKRTELIQKLGKSSVNIVNAPDLIQYAANNGLKSILERYKENIVAHIEVMKCDLKKMQVEAS
jgi:hypothetical protein